jgi:hypothetical protein
MKYKILIIFHTLNNENPSGDPSIWYRCLNFRNLFSNKTVDIKLLNQNIINNELIEDFNYSEFDLYIFFRPVATEYFSNFLMNCSRNNKQTAASYDDLTFLMSSWGHSTGIKSGQRRALMQQRYGKAADAFDCFENFIVSSNNLANRISEIKLASNIVCIENILPKSYLEYTEHLYKRHNKENLIGYFGGGISHTADIKSVQEIIYSFCKDNNTKLLCPNYLLDNIEDTLKEYVIPFPRVSIAKMLEIYGMTKMNLAPLALDENSKAKSSLKYIESISSFAPLVASPLDSYNPYRKLKTLKTIDNNTSWENSIKSAWDLSMDTKTIVADRNSMIRIASEINHSGFKKIIQWVNN